MAHLPLFPYIQVMFMVNVGEYTVHGWNHVVSTATCFNCLAIWIPSDIAPKEATNHDLRFTND